MATACANSTIINSNNNEYNLYYANCRRLNLQSGMVQNLKNKFMAIIESEKTSQISEEKNIRKYKSLENIENNCISTILSHHKSLESINDSINNDADLIVVEPNKNSEDNHFDFATIQSKFGKPTENVRKRHTTKINPYSYQQSPLHLNEKGGDIRLGKNYDDKESKVQQIKNMFSKKLKHVDMTNYDTNKKTNIIIDQLESHYTMDRKQYINSQINVVENTASLGAKSFVKSSSGIYFYYNKQDAQFLETGEEAPADEVLVCNDSYNHLSKILNNKISINSQKPRVIGIASAEVQKIKIPESLHNKCPIQNSSRKTISNDSFPKNKMYNDPDGYWRVTRDLVHKIRAKGRSYRFENGKKQELPTTIFLPMFKTNLRKESKNSNDIVTNVMGNDKNKCFFYPNFNTNHDNISKFTKPINANKKTAYSIVTPLYKETYSIINGPKTLQTLSKPCRNHIDTTDTKRIKTHFNDDINLNHEFANEVDNSVECELNDYNEDLTEEYYNNLSKQIEVFGAYIKLEKNCFLQSDRKKSHRIKFDTAEPLTYEYPSEQSLLEQELENEDVKARINAFNIKAAAAAEAIVCKESKTSLRYLPVDHNTRFEDFKDKISPKIKKIDVRSAPRSQALSRYPDHHSEETDIKMAKETKPTLVLHQADINQPSTNEGQSQKKALNDAEIELSKFIPKNLKNNIRILSFNHTLVKFDDPESKEDAQVYDQEESSMLLHTYPIPADDLVTSKWSATTTHYSDLLF